MLANEVAITGLPPARIQKRLEAILDAMIACVERGLEAEGYLPGPIGLHRKGPLLHQRARRMPHNPTRFLLELCAYAAYGIAVAASRYGTSSAWTRPSAPWP